MSKSNKNASEAPDSSTYTMDRRLSCFEEKLSFYFKLPLTYVFYETDHSRINWLVKEYKISVDRRNKFMRSIVLPDDYNNILCAERC